MYARAVGIHITGRFRARRPNRCGRFPGMPSQPPGGGTFNSLGVTEHPGGMGPTSAGPRWAGADPGDCHPGLIRHRGNPAHPVPGWHLRRGRRRISPAHRRAAPDPAGDAVGLPLTACAASATPPAETALRANPQTAPPQSGLPRPSAKPRGRARSRPRSRAGSGHGQARRLPSAFRRASTRWPCL